MKNVLFIIGLFISTLAIGQSKESYLCGAETKKGTPCKNRVTESGKHCYLHGGEVKNDVKLIATQCTAIAKSTQNQCRNKTTDKSGLCHVHNK